VNIPLILFAKAPVAGQVKTRLQSHCRAEQAAQIFEILLETTIQNVCQHWPGKVVLSVWLDHQHPFLQGLVKNYPLQLDHQVAGHLGEKMRAALDQWGFPAAVMGCDVPHVPAATLKLAYHQLSNKQSVIGPSKDGGYYLLGLAEQQGLDINTISRALFADQAWGSESVLTTTLERAALSLLDLFALDQEYDIDNWSELLRAADQLPDLARYLAEQGLLQPS